MSADSRIPLPQALNIYCEHLGLPDDFAKKVKAFALHNADDIIWLSDQPLMVYKEGPDSVVSLEELTKLLDAVDPIIWPDAT